MSDSDKRSVHQIDDKKDVVGDVHEVDVNPVAAKLAAATEAHKPSLVSPGMLKLWMIIGIGMNVFQRIANTD